MTSEFRKVEALLALGRSEEAAALADRLPARESPTPEYLRLRGRALRAAGRVFDAEACFREALAMTPGEPALLADLATTLLGQKRAKEAHVFAQEAVALRPEVAAFHCLLGVIAESLDYDEEAERELSAARQLAPTDAETHTVYGWHALRDNRPDDAEGAFRAALAIQPDRVEALRGVARCACARGDWMSGRKAWLDALSVDPLQKDRILQRALVLGHPGMGPVRIAMGMPMALSIVLAVAGAILLVRYRHEGGASILAIALFALSAVGPLARTAVEGSLRE